MLYKDLIISFEIYLTQSDQSINAAFLLPEIYRNILIRKQTKKWSCWFIPMAFHSTALRSTLNMTAEIAPILSWIAKI